jgi:hypothetical protein
MSDLGGTAAPLAVGRAASLLVALLAVGLLGAEPSMAAPAAPHWSIVSQAEPTYFNAGDTDDAYRLTIRNDGALATTPGGAVTLTDNLPAGVTATRVSSGGEAANGNGSPEYAVECPGGLGTGTITCIYKEDAEHGAVLAGASIVLTIAVSVDAGVKSPLVNSATVSGGGAPSAAVGETTRLDTSTVPFGLSYFTADVVGENGEADTQAGSHPFELTTSLAFNISAREPPGGSELPLANAAPKDVEVVLPPGMLGNPQAVPQCSQKSFQERETLDCPLDTQVGTVKPFFYGAFHTAVYPVFNLAPPPGQPAELGFSIARIGHVPMFFQIQRGEGGQSPAVSDYNLAVRLANIPETGPMQGVILSLWGVPAARSHDLEREGTVGQGRQQFEEFCKPLVKVVGGIETQQGCPSGIAARPFLTLPGRCEGAFPVDVLVDSWQRPSELVSFAPEQKLTPLSGCEHLSFSPSIALIPEITQADTPSGYTLDVHIPQDEEPTALATPELRSVLVSLPLGTVLSPSAGDGLQGCTANASDLAGSAGNQFGLESTGSASCPAASQIGTLQIVTPLLSSPLQGGVFLAKPECEPCTASDAQDGRMIRLLLQAQGAGITIKLAGSIMIDQATGQLTASFGEDPQLPWEDLKLTLNGGSRAPLANPSTCGVSLAATARLTPYSGQVSAQQSSEPFELNGCAPPRFTPSFLAGTTNNQAGAFSPETVTLSRTDEDQHLEAITVRTPPGLLGMLSKVTPCAEAQTLAQACGPASRIGTATVGLGPGANPLFVRGDVYLTGPHDGAPFGLSIVVAATVGPLDLGALAISASIRVDPSTAALTITSDPLPQMVDGTPLQIKTVNLDLERDGGFIVNPTNCRPWTITGSLRSTQGSLAAGVSRFQAANCATLAFRPKLTALTHARPSKALGAYLHVKLLAGAGDANIAKLKLDLPKQLPARQATLGKACLASVLGANPADCPAGSVVGAATAVTPVLANPLSGPVYLVSHGGSASPALEIVLQGEGVILLLGGQTSITDHIISSAFRSLPDAPITTFDLVLDQGPHSALAANIPAGGGGEMCGQSLLMPVAITAQNGAVVKETTKIAVSGCPKRRSARRPRRRL